MHRGRAWTCVVAVTLTVLLGSGCSSSHSTTKKSAPTSVTSKPPRLKIADEPEECSTTRMPICPLPAPEGLDGAVAETFRLAALTVNGLGDPIPPYGSSGGSAGSGEFGTPGNWQFTVAWTRTSDPADCNFVENLHSVLIGGTAVADSRTLRFREDNNAMVCQVEIPAGGDRSPRHELQLLWHEKDYLWQVELQSVFLDMGPTPTPLYSESKLLSAVGKWPPVRTDRLAATGD